ncbi:hypothetical protein SPONN_2375 [uncultured Candidatus Thioglobus sp.]|nr:hypothetical protein SPONN_2375 [uncultured Candidatus Thioglobus sp.]
MYIPVSYLFWGGLKGLAELLSLPLNSVLHLSNVGVHIINGLLVFTVLKQFVVNKWALLIGVLFFLLHPIQVEAVAWVSEFRNLLAFAFSLSALYVYLKNQTRFSYVALLLFVLAVLSKPSAVVLPLIIFTINYFYYGFSLKDNFIKALPFLIITLFIVVTTYLIQSNYSDFEQQHTLAYWQRPFAWLDSIVFYVSKFIYPYHLGASYTLSPKFIAQQWWFYPLTLLPLALAYFNRSIKLYPADAKKNLGITLNHRGGLFFSQKKYQKALADFSQAVVLDPSSNDSNSNNIGVLFTLKRCKQAYLALDFARKNKVKLGKPLLTGLQQNCPRQ